MKSGESANRVRSKHWRRTILAVIILVHFSLFRTNAQDPPPNIIVFIADDVSWNDLGCYGNTIVHTPNIDRLAENGLKFTNFYLTASSCSPSRNSILTGRYPHNTGAAELHTEPPINMLSFPELLRRQNYYSVQAGKFHMGEYARRGFDKVYENLEEVGDGGEAKWISSVKERPQDRPFFMWFASHDAHRNWGPNEFAGAHNPNQITPPTYLADDDATKMDLAKYYDEIKRFDYYIGEVVRELQYQKVLENTLIIIMSDNGRPFPHSKTRLNDRGIKTPFVMYWKEKITDNTVCNSLVSVIDIAPTILNLTGISIPEQFQGRSFDRLINAPKSDFRNYIFAEHNWHDYEAHGRMVRNKDFMYILNSRPMKAQLGPADVVSSPSFNSLEKLKFEGSLSGIQGDIFTVPRSKEELYDLNKDPHQSKNLAKDPRYYVTLMKFRKLLEEWMLDTADNIPENLTKDWYLMEPGYIKTEFHSIRGEMPGAENNAVQNNNKGKF